MSGIVPPNQPCPRSPSSDTSEHLTPRRKVQALLGQISDSGSDCDSRAGSSSSAFRLQRYPTKNHNHNNERSDSDGEDEIQPIGKHAARLHEDTREAHSVQKEQLPTTGISLQSSPTLDAQEGAEATQFDTDDNESSEDEIRRGRRGRDLLLTQNDSRIERTDAAERNITSSRSASILSSKSPSDRISVHGVVSHSPPVGTGRSKFLALVQKHRKERLAREAAEIAKRAAGVQDDKSETPGRRGPRGSSPADDSNEDDDSDDSSAQRISKQARPTRKASKKALEEMNRETQRMSRNMQLAHKAQTKRKITKDSLLARFNFLPSPSMEGTARNSKSSNASSPMTSDNEACREHETPPTSPLQESDSKVAQKGLTTNASLYEMCGALLIGGSLPDIANTEQREPGQEKIQEYIRNDRTVFSPEPERLFCPESSLLRKKLVANSVVDTGSKVPVRKYNLPSQSSGSESDIEIVNDKGLKRKYAAFETLPKRKAKEKPSHIALRSLAHLVANDDKKRSMNAAEMQSSLRRKARLQAIEERKLRVGELRARGIIIQSAEERERDQQEVEDLVERARQEAAEIQKREKELAKKEGTYVRDRLDDEDDSDDEDFEEDLDDAGADSGSEEDDNNNSNNDQIDKEYNLVDNEVIEAESEEDAEVASENEITTDVNGLDTFQPLIVQTRNIRKCRIVSDDEEEDDSKEPSVNETLQSPLLPRSVKTPRSAPRSVRKIIPGLQMSDDLPMGLSQAFAATMAESQDDDADADMQEHDSLDLVADLPSPNIAPMALLRRLDSLDFVTDSLPATQTQPLDVDMSFCQGPAVPESPARGLQTPAPQFTPSQRTFELTQDAGYLLSPFSGSRFAGTPNENIPQSTIETLLIPDHTEDSPVAQRKGKLKRGRTSSEEETDLSKASTAFQVMKQAAKNKAGDTSYDKTKSEARRHFDEAAEESEDEYAGLGGASDDENGDEETEEDRRMIDEDTQVGQGDEAKLAGFYADRERERDEKDVSKLLKDITTGALRRKRGAGDDLDLSDEEDAIARRREAKRREFARMRRELLKDEAVGKIAEDRKKEAFLRSIEDRELADEDEDNDHLNEGDTQVDDFQSPSNATKADTDRSDERAGDGNIGNSRPPLLPALSSKLNRLPATSRRTDTNINRKPVNLNEIRESVSFLIEEPDSQAATVDLGLSDSEDEPEAFVNLDRHLHEADNDENLVNDDDARDLGDFIVDDEEDAIPDFKKPQLPKNERAPYSQRRTKHENVIDRLSLLREASSSSAGGSNTSTKLAFVSKAASGSFSGVPTLLRRATTNSSLGSMSGRDKVSATGVTTNNGTSKTERGDASTDKEFIRKGSSGRRNAVNYQVRTTLKEEKMSERAGIVKAAKKKGTSGGFLNGLFRGDSNWH